VGAGGGRDDDRAFNGTTGVLSANANVLGMDAVGALGGMVVIGLVLRRRKRSAIADAEIETLVRKLVDVEGYNNDNRFREL
jgi:hypothetical protein